MFTDLGDFIDNTEKYEGQTLLMSMVLVEPCSKRKWGSLRDLVGSRAVFRVNNGVCASEIDIDLPQGLVVPNVENGFASANLLVVHFRCTKGLLDEGNIATSITRPPRAPP